ncbi:adhesin [Bacillus cereus]|uniref:adhesin n=1 Tax=Bacillus cereus TaxID=1396 RepID=UPI000BFE90D6|nr:adhesin [Bacillus cereus]PGQ62498.1 adhesin [Bacillus cereus]PGY65343.1 adhesin [Bacillus cereus]
MPLDYSKILKKVLLTTTVTTLSVGVVTGCSLFSSEKKSTKTASVSKKKKDSEKEKKKDEKKDESKNETNENLNTNDFDEIIDNAKRSSDQNLAGIIENNKTKKKFDDLTDSIATAAINSDRNLASVIDGDKSSNRFSDLNNSIVSATNNPSVSDNKDSKNFVFGGDLNINDGVAIADNSIPPINNDKKPPTSSDTSGGEVKPPIGGEGNNGGGTKPPTGGDNDGGGTTKPEKDTVAPVITAKQGVTVYVGDSLNTRDLVDVRDNKDPNPEVTVGAYDTSKVGEIQVTVTATDASGNSSSTTVTVNVVEKEEEKDTEAPVITVKQGVTVYVGDSLNAGDLVDVRDNKDPNPEVTVGAYDTSEAGEIQVTVTATDASGNSSSTTVTVKVVEKEEEKDTEAPVITAKQDVTVHVGDSLNAEDLVEVKDNKDSNPVVTVGVYDTSKPGTISIQVTATDNAGNSSTVTVTVKVVEKEEEKDTEAPVITAKQVVTVHVGDKLSPGSLASVKDNKDSNPVVTVGAYDTSKPGTISVQVTATDKAGNSSTETVNVVVLEKEKPEQKTAETTSKEQGNGLLALNSNDVAK